jgi:predicted protein tyrosine phosphatase
MTRNNTLLKVLFVCSRNQWRSPTAEQVWRRHPALLVRSGGTSRGARHPVSADDVAWADAILVMEEKHKSRLRAEFGRLLEPRACYALLRARVGSARQRSRRFKSLQGKSRGGALRLAITSSQSQRGYLKVHNTLQAHACAGYP